MRQVQKEETGNIKQANLIGQRNRMSVSLKRILLFGIVLVMLSVVSCNDQLFVKVAQEKYAVSLVEMSDYKGNIMVTFGITKRTPPGNRSDSPMVALTIIDDQGEVYNHPSASFWDTRDFGYADNKGSIGRINLSSLIPPNSLPKDYTWLAHLVTEVPSLALGHIDKVLIDGKEVQQAEFKLADLSQIENVVHIGQNFQVSDSVSITVLDAYTSSNKEGNSIHILVDVANSSYNERYVSLHSGFQITDGTLYTAIHRLDDTSECTLSGKSRENVLITIDSGNMYYGQPILSYLLYVNCGKNAQVPLELRAEALRIVIPYK